MADRKGISQDSIQRLIGGLFFDRIDQLKKFIPDNQVYKSVYREAESMCDMREVYLEEGIAKGIAKGIEEGRVEGREEGNIVGDIRVYLLRGKDKEFIWNAIYKKYSCTKEQFESYYKEAEERNRQDI